MKIASNRSLAAALALSLILAPCADAATKYKHADSRQPRYSPAVGVDGLQPAQTMAPKNIPDFAARGSSGAPQSSGSFDTGSGTALKADLASTTLPVETRLRLVLETAVDAKASQPGDLFEAHVKDDLYVGMTLLLPRGSFVRGRVAQVVKPRLLSRAAKIGLKLEQIVTPSGEVIPLDASVEFKKGLSNKKGELDPGTSFGTRVEGNVKAVAGVNPDGSTKGALVAANIATLGAPVIATAIGSSAIALFSQGDNVSLGLGQEIEVLLTNDLGVQIN